MSARQLRNAAETGPSRAAVAIHASALVIGETGVLIRGPSGSGKSSLTLALLALADDRRLFARLIGDDRVLMRSRRQRILVEGPLITRGLIERRGYGIDQERAESCAILRLVIDLCAERARIARMPEPEETKVLIGKIELPRLAFDGESGPFERAYGVLRYLGRLDDKIMTRFAHFA
jgi:HPr kinase/phosphorylase